jgi:hypothetical protein
VRREEGRQVGHARRNREKTLAEMTVLTPVIHPAIKSRSVKTGRISDANHAAGNMSARALLRRAFPGKRRRLDRRKRTKEE